MFQLSVPRVTGWTLSQTHSQVCDREGTRARWGGRPSLLGWWNTKWGSVLIPNAKRGLPLQRLPRPGLVSCCLKGYRTGGSPQSGKDESRPSAGDRSGGSRARALSHSVRTIPLRRHPVGEVSRPSAGYRSGGSRARAFVTFVRRATAPAAPPGGEMCPGRARPTSSGGCRARTLSHSSDMHWQVEHKLLKT